MVRQNGLFAWCGAGLAAGLLLIVPAVSDAAGRKSAEKAEKPEISAQAKPEPAAPRPPQRTPFSVEDQAAAIIPGIPDARFWADSEQDFVRALPSYPGAWLVLSGGGADGAFGAGLLNGWTQSGTRPDFTVVTGVSTGGLLATMAFLGSSTDERLREQFTSVSAADIFEIGATGISLFDTWPLKQLIAREVTAERLADVAREYQRGRRLFVVTTNLDAERPIVWNMGAIATHGGEQGLQLFRDVLLASAALPGLFPPVTIETESNGKVLQELHAEGGLGGPFFVAPHELLSRAKGAHLPATELTIVVNSKLAPDFYMTPGNTAGVLARSISAALKSFMRTEVERIYAMARREGIGFKVAYVDSAFSVQARGPFDTEYMRALFEHGAEGARTGAAFRSEPPGS